MADNFAAYADDVGSPARRAVAVAPSDTVDLGDIPKALYVGTAGNITMVGVAAPAGATGIVWKNVPAGTILPFRPRRVMATGTTAADIVALY